MAEVYVSTDVEADGPIPGPHSMLSFASAAYRADKTLVGTFEANLTVLPGARGDPKTMEWWQGQPEAWAACRTDTREPGAVMPEYVAWLKSLPGKPVFVAYPAAYDFMFVYWYLIRFAGESPFSHSALDIKSYAMALLGTRVPRVGQAQHAGRVVRRPAPHARRPRRRQGAGGLVLQHAGRSRSHGQPRRTGRSSRPAARLTPHAGPPL